MKSPYFLLVGTIVTQLSTSSKLPECGKNSFYDSAAKQCRACSTCPMNHIIKIPCSETADLECLSYNITTDNQDVDNAYGEEEDEEDEGEEPTTLEKEDREYWKSLAFALIGLLSILIVVATVVVLVACRKLQKATIVKQPDDGDADDADSGYVVIRAIRSIAEPRPLIPNYSMYLNEECNAHPPLLSVAYPRPESQPGFDPSLGFHAMPGRLCFLPKVYKPQRRLLTYDADDVFESDDSGGAYMPPLTSKLYTVTENSASSSSKASDT